MRRSSSDGDEAAEFEKSGDGDRKCGYGLRAEFWEECGEEPVERYGPEDGRFDRSMTPLRRRR